MGVATKSEAALNAAVLFDAAKQEQDRLRVALSPEEFEADRTQKWERFNQLCEEASREAQANGLTEEILAALLAEK